MLGSPEVSIGNADPRIQRGKQRDAVAAEATWVEVALAALPQLRYQSGCELGCGTGRLTVRLAQHCQRLLAFEQSPQLLQQARARCRHLRNVSFACLVLPQMQATARFDLVVLHATALACVAEPGARVLQLLRRSAHLLIVRSQRSAAFSDQFSEYMARSPQLKSLYGYRTSSYQLDVWQCCA